MKEEMNEEAVQAIIGEVLEMPDVFCPITNYLIDMSTESVREPDSYPIDIVVEGRLQRGHIIKAEQRMSEGCYQLDLHVQTKHTNYHLRKQCISAAGSQVDWDNIHCTIDIMHSRSV